MLIRIRVIPSIERRPLGFILEQPHSLDIVLVIRREAMIYPRRQDDQIVLLEPDPDPIVTFRSDIEVASAVSDVSDLFIFMQVLVEEHFHF